MDTKSKRFAWSTTLMTTTDSDGFYKIGSDESKFKGNSLKA
jgi:hypothetical protein